ncbi:MAG: GrpB family protein [Pseudomonadota bacterium]
MVKSVVDHSPQWKFDFEREAAALRDALRSTGIVFHHIGSTSIEGILAKPIIDLLGAADDLGEIDTRSAVLEQLGYEAMGEYGIDGRRYFRKINGCGIRTHHLHIFVNGSPHIDRHLAFRDYLRAHSERAAEYSDLKARLAASDKVSWDDYVKGKAPFIRATEQDALKWYRSSDGR